MREPGFLPEIGALAGHLEVAPGDLEIFRRGGGGGAEGVVGVVGVEEVVDDGSGLHCVRFKDMSKCGSRILFLFSSQERQVNKSVRFLPRTK